MEGVSQGVGNFNAQNLERFPCSLSVLCRLWREPESRTQLNLEGPSAQRP